MRRIITLCLALLIAASLECAYPQQDRNYSEADSDIKVNAGDNIIITLEANYVTPFRWQLAEPLDNDKLRLVNVAPILGYARFQGAGGKEVWTIRAVGVGKTTISLGYVNPREMNMPAAKEKIFTVTVAGASGVAEEPDREVSDAKEE